MKRFFLVAFVSILLAACGGKDSYKITGTIEGLENGAVVTLNVIDFNSLMELDSAVVKNGRFTFKGHTDTANIAFITFDLDDNIGGCELFLESGSINVSIDAFEGKQRVGGTPNNDAFQDFVDNIQVLNDEADEIGDKIRISLAAQEDCSSLYDQMGDLEERFKKIVAETIRDNADKLFGYRQLMDNYNMYEPEEVMEFLTLLAPSFGTDYSLGQLTSMIGAQLNVSLGHQYLDFEAPILDKKGNFSNTAKLSDYVSKNKIVLLDFWASWCTPCINEIPNLKAAYKKFKAKGFEIVSVSVDEETEDWIKAVKDNGLTWVQLWNGDEELENSPAMDYVISAIPSTFLIDADGTIIGRNLRDSELEEALGDYFSNK